MTYEKPLIPGVLRGRRWRFFADVQLADGRMVTAHCPNTGSMRSCSAPGSPVFLSESANPARRLRYTLELVDAGSALVGVHTGRTNRIVEEALEQRQIPELAVYTRWKREARFLDSRFDFRLEGPAESVFVEVKNVTLVEAGVAMFPDAVTLRGQKHLRTLIRARAKGHGAVMIYLVPRGDAHVFAPADHIDRDYGRILRRAAGRGVQIVAWRALVQPEGITLDAPLPIDLPRIRPAIRRPRRRGLRPRGGRTG